MALSGEVKAARKAARRAAAERQAEQRAEVARLAEVAEHAKRFNNRSTRKSVDESIDADALTIEEYRIADGRGLVGPASHAEPRNPFDEAAATEWLGLPVTTRSMRQALTHGDQTNDFYVPSAAEISARERDDALTRRMWGEDGGWVDLEEIDEQTLEDLGVDVVDDSTWFPDYFDRYAMQAATVEGLFDGADPEDPWFTEAEKKAQLRREILKVAEDLGIVLGVDLK